MLSLFSTWTGLFKYDNPRMPKASVTMTFQEVNDREFKGFVTEQRIILSDTFLSAHDFNFPDSLTPWGTIAGEITMGDITKHVYGEFGRSINFVKTPDQLTSYPVYCWGGCNEQEGLILGRWGVLEGDTPCSLQPNMRMGDFALRRFDGRKRESPQMMLPVDPELLSV